MSADATEALEREVEYLRAEVKRLEAIELLVNGLLAALPEIAKTGDTVFISVVQSALDGSLHKTAELYRDLYLEWSKP